MFVRLLGVRLVVGVGVGVMNDCDCEFVSHLLEYVDCDHFGVRRREKRL
jgi:hypothetical protein